MHDSRATGPDAGIHPAVPLPTDPEAAGSSAGAMGSAAVGEPAPAWVRVRDLGRHVGDEVTVRGWLTTKRSSGKIRFLVIRDGSGVVQCVIARSNVDADTFARLAAA